MRRIAPIVFVLASSLTLGASALSAQQQGAPPASTSPVVTPIPGARPEDVGSVEAILAALYDVISGPVGQARDWNRMRSLFIPGGRLMPLGARPGGGVGVRIMDVDDYIALNGPRLVSVGFREREVARRVERFGSLAHVFSTYEGRLETEGTTIRGINSIQLLHDGTRWWVVSVYWQAENPTLQLPPEYLASPR
jgi:hypothetical protein